MQQRKIEHIPAITYFVITTGNWRNLKEGELCKKEIKPATFLYPYIHQHLIAVFNSYAVVSQKFKLMLKLRKTAFFCFDSCFRLALICYKHL